MVAIFGIDRFDSPMRGVALARRATQLGVENGYNMCADGCQTRAVMSVGGRVSRVRPVHTAKRNCTRDEERPFEVGNQVLISSRKLRRS
jgi:hypothetical protein